MFTFIVLTIIAILWYSANARYARSGQWRFRRLRSAYAWAFVGAIIGSFFGVAGFGFGIIGTLPGALIGYLLVNSIMKTDPVSPSDRPNWE